LSGSLRLDSKLLNGAAPVEGGPAGDEGELVCEGFVVAFDARQERVEGRDEFVGVFFDLEEQGTSFSPEAPT
jgi:hypothetical protein